MNSMLGGVTGFGQAIQSLITQSKLDLLASFFSSLPYAPGFHNHHPDIYDELGRAKDKDAENTASNLMQFGGTEDELKAFIETAKKCAVEIGQSESVKRMLTSSGKVRAKKKVKTVEEKYQEEVHCQEGVERVYSDSFASSGDMDLSSLEVDPVLKTRISIFHVEGIKKEMLSRFDPSLISIVVRPAEVSKFDPHHPERSKYYVIQGVHSFTALCNLKKEGKLHRLPGMGEGSVSVTIVNIEDTELVLYGHLRSNALASTFVRKPQPQVRQVEISTRAGTWVLFGVWGGGRKKTTLYKKTGHSLKLRFNEYN